MAEERQVSATELADSIEHYANAFRVFRDGLRWPRRFEVSNRTNVS
jgi:hypothetical protein